MVKRVAPVTGLGRSGSADWLIQRVSALLMLAYTIFLLAVYFCHAPLDYATWHNLFSLTSMRIFTLLTLLALLGHAWVGIWTIFTDYIKNAVLRGSLQILVIFGFMGALIWGVQILWS